MEVQISQSIIFINNIQFWYYHSFWIDVPCQAKFFSQSVPDLCQWRCIKFWNLQLSDIQQMKKNLFLALAILIFILVRVTQTKKKLIYVHQFFRHGVRYPIKPKPNDFSMDIPHINNLRGELGRQGKSQHYLLGQVLYKTYWKALFGNNNKHQSNKFYFKSTGYNRTIQSLQAQLFGIFENTQVQKISEAQIPFSVPIWNKKLSRKAGNLYGQKSFFHTLPIHIQIIPQNPSQSHQDDVLLAFQPKLCAKQNDWIAANRRNPHIIKITQNPNFTNAIHRLQKALGYNISFYDVVQYYDDAYCLTNLGMKALSIFKQNTQVAQDLHKIYDLAPLMQKLYTEQQSKIFATGVFKQIVDNFKRVTASQQGVQWSIFSAHESTLQNILTRLGMMSVDCIYANYLNGTKSSEYCILQTPQFSSQLIFEVYQSAPEQNTFKIRYNGNYRRIPLCNYELECDVDDFYEWFDGWKVDNWLSICKSKINPSQGKYMRIKKSSLKMSGPFLYGGTHDFQVQVYK